MTAPQHDNATLLNEVNHSGVWFRAKKTRPIWAKLLGRAEMVRTLEGEGLVAAGNFVCRGEAGDLWPQSPENLEKRYAPTNEVDAHGWRKYKPHSHVEGVMAAQMPHAFEVQTQWGILSGKQGDYLLKNYHDHEIDYPDDVWVVDQTLFKQTYEAVTKE